MAGITEWHDKNASKFTEEANNGLKRKKLTIRQGLVHEKSESQKNECLETRSRHKRSRMSNRSHRRAFRPWQTHKQQTSFGHTQKCSTHKA